jgi:hypothetical protein
MCLVVSRAKLIASDVRFFCCQFGGDRLCSSKGVGSAPMKMLIDDEISGDVRH